MPSPESGSSSDSLEFSPNSASSPSRSQCPVIPQNEEADEIFNDNELLFRRVLKEQILGGHPLPYCFGRLPLSVNRGKYSYPRCLLCEKANGGPFMYPITNNA